MATLHPARLAASLAALALVALLATACSGEKEAEAPNVPDTGSALPSGLAATLYASPT